jgi:hypothetical protein
MKAQGVGHLKAHGQGKPLTQRKSMLVKCSECTSHYTDGREDCGILGCPLYPFTPYGKAPRKKKASRPRYGEGSDIRATSFSSRNRSNKGVLAQEEANL